MLEKSCERGDRIEGAKYVKDSQVEMTELILPSDANPFGFLLGGRLMHWIDICAAMSAMKHAGKVVVTASVDELNFLCPIKIGEVVILKASVNRVFRTSMEVGVKVFAMNPLTGELRHANSAYLTFVAIDENGKPIPVPPIVPETEDEKRRYEEALIRRQQRLKHKEELKNARKQRAENP
ncbi:Acyl-CoA hydrolase [Candidatus Kryptobacter tengchongensis]|uniref:Acyl-CoA hydrolase n=2 Tax=Kryptobacter tengchongensis TaxID=1643429 RepID=A0A656DDD6_KRYT1|nr:acyl-CoA thioesterase [Candidatus Kryptobacter tengchongensis]CUT01758.1 Acyl-CoA hydrolase [Candidatus Kryptobacter tengchongensis]CUT06067.1 Acyl-CoA hydrolase [Candidatus Kryptobacter tengchongensis]CUU09455.1 Acyl-CoA hydrolase [Candidatus Kryptobacter tengchongensis]